MARAKLWMESHHHGNQVTSSRPPDESFQRLDSIRNFALHAEAQVDERIVESRKAARGGLRDDRGAALLLDLSGDKNAALEWAKRSLSNATIQSINKADLKWGSKRKALARARALAPATFAIFTSDLSVQSARSAITLFAALSGARRIVFADRNGRSITRSRAGAFIIEGARLALESLIGYAVVVPLSWLLAMMLSASLVFRKVLRADRNEMIRRDAGKDESLKALYVRATIVPFAPQTAASAGGMASHVRGFARGALALNHRVEFISSGDVGIKCDETRVRVISPSSTLSATRALFELWNNLVFTFKATSYITTAAHPLADAAFIYQRYSRFNFTGAALSIITGLPFVLEYNGSEVWASRNWDPVGQLSLLKRFERLNQRAADLIFVVSDVERRNLIAEGVIAERVVVNPNGVDTVEFRPGCGGCEARRALGVEGKIVVGFLGTFGPWHGAPVLARAATQARERARCHFLFVGDGDQRSETEGIIESAGIKSCSTFTGRIAHAKVAAYLDACDLLVSPHVPAADGSEFFGSPTKLFEYMAMARPVIASRLGQIADVIIDGENGLLVEPGDADALARAIDRLANDEALRARLGAAARQTVIERYTWRHNAARVFNAVMKKG
jgi:glycosyltransferase involved in cell wall biosynthesis